MQAIKAYYEEGKFIPVRPINIPKGSQAIVTILDATFGIIQPDADADATSIDSRHNRQKLQEESITHAIDEEMQMRKEWLNSLKQARDLANDDPLIDFPTRQPMREPHGFAD
ncbi:MAG: antitoxin family protein [Defluviitaleaceae bacterium]|nr:antitoxin family protein [Defluviitaleaceae bacterium]